MSRLLLLATITALTITSAEALGQKGDVTWVGGTGFWSDPDNWTPPSPNQGIPQSFLIDNGNSIASEVLMDIDDLASQLTIDADDSLTIQDGSLLTFNSGQPGVLFSNFGVVTIEGSLVESGILVNGIDLTVSGGGTIHLSGSGFSTISAATGIETLTLNDQTIAGVGTISMASLTLSNFSSLNANSPFQTLAIDLNNGTLDNGGLIAATNDGRVSLSNCTVTNTGQFFVDGNGQINLNNVTLTGSSLETAGNGLIRAHLNPCTWQDVASSANFEVISVPLTFLGTITNNGSLTLVSEINQIAEKSDISTLIIPPGSGNVTLTGSGRLLLNNGRIYSGEVGVDGGRLINDTTHCIMGGGQIGKGTIGFRNNGIIIANGEDETVFDPKNNSTVVNAGTMRAVSAGGLVMTNGDFKNEGTIEVLNGSRCFYTASSYELMVDSTSLNGGTWKVISDGDYTSIIIPSPNIFFNLADVTLSGKESHFNLINSMAVNSGSFTIRNGRDFQTGGSFFSNSGVLTIGATSTMTVNGQYTQSSSGTLTLELGVISNEVSETRLDVNGSAALNGTFEIDVVSGFDFSVDQTLRIMTANSFTGSFDEVILPQGFEINFVPGAIEVSYLACTGDLNYNDTVNIDDLLILIGQWGPCPGAPLACPADINANNVVNVDDLMALMSAWGPCM